MAGRAASPWILTDTLMPTREALIDLLNAQHGTKIDAADCREFFLQKQWNLKREQFLEFFAANQETIHARSPFDGVRETLAEWEKAADLYVITGRPEIWKGSAERWLERENIPVQGVWYTQPGKNKADWVRARGVQFIVEDRVDFATQVADAGVPVILLDRPYNRELVHPMIYRVADWRAARLKVAEMHFLCEPSPVLL